VTAGTLPQPTIGSSNLIGDQKGSVAMPFVVHFDDFTHELRPLLGGKNGSLGEMTKAGLPVPPGFAVTTEAFDKFWADTDIALDLKELLSSVDPSDLSGLAPTSEAVRSRIDAAPLDSNVAKAVTMAYEQLCDRCGVKDLPVAVRSSATCEASPNASFAGAHDTFLWVRGHDKLVRHIGRCWSSLWTVRAICYRARIGYPTATASMSVGVQRMVRAKVVGVASTLNPANGDRSQVAIEASLGIGKSVVTGEVTPDHYLVDKVIYAITRRQISNNTTTHCINKTANEHVGVSDPTSTCLSDPEVRAVAHLARLTELHYGSPQDIEWAVDADSEPPNNVFLLQARPETVWSRKEHLPVAATTTVIRSIASTLCAPLRRNATN
jgi:pyruvate,water dikinase